MLFSGSLHSPTFNVLGLDVYPVPHPRPCPWPFPGRCPARPEFCPRPANLAWVIIEWCLVKIFVSWVLWLVPKNIRILNWSKYLYLEYFDWSRKICLVKIFVSWAFWLVGSQLTKFLDSQLTRLHLHFAPKKSLTFVWLVSSQLKINVGRRGTNWAQSPPDLEWYLGVLVKHTTEIPPPGCLSRRRILKMIHFKLWVLDFTKPNPCAHMLPVAQGKRVSKSSMAFWFSSTAFRFSSTAFQFSSTAFCFPRNLRKSIYGEKYTKDHCLSFVFFATRSPTRAPSFVIRYNTQQCTDSLSVLTLATSI